MLLDHSSKYNVPLVFTHHTLYEENVHYVPGNQEALKKFVIELSTGYAKLADQVIAPSESVMKLLQERGVTTAINVVPTGIDNLLFVKGNRDDFRRKFNIPLEAFVIGHLGRLAPEKNVEFITKAACAFLKNEPSAHLMIAGKGTFEENIIDICQLEGLSDRLHMVGIVKGQELIDAYFAMDVFAFASQSETQGMVLTEAMAAGIPVVAVDAPGVREVVRDYVNGRLLMQENITDFLTALTWVKNQSSEDLAKIKNYCRETAKQFAMEISLDKICIVYKSCIRDGFVRKDVEGNFLESTMRLIQAQWGLTANLGKATAAMMRKLLSTTSTVNVNEAAFV